MDLAGLNWSNHTIEIRRWVRMIESHTRLRFIDCITHPRTESMADIVKASNISQLIGRITFRESNESSIHEQGVI